MTTQRLRTAAARYALGIATAEELVVAADAALAEGVYSYSLGELATTRHPTLRDHSILFQAALRELSVALPTKEEAAHLLAWAYFVCMAEDPSPWDALGRFASERYRPSMFDEVWKHIEDASGCRSLLYSLSEYEYLTSCIEEGYDSAATRQSLEALEAQVIEVTRRWVRERGRVRIDPAWAARNGGVVRRLAAAIDEERAFDRMPVLADALEDAGCTDAELLAHCRGPGPHAGGCWVVDLLLGKA